MSNTDLFHHSGPVDVNSYCCSQNCSKSNSWIILYHTFTSLTLVILFLLEVSLSSEPSTHTGPVWLLQDLPLRTIQCHMMTIFFAHYYWYANFCFPFETQSSAQVNYGFDYFRSPLNLYLVHVLLLQTVVLQSN